MRTNGQKLLLSVHNPASSLVGAIFFVLGLIMLLIICIMFLVSGVDYLTFFDVNHVEDWLLYFLLGTCGLLFAVIGFVVRQVSQRKKRRIQRLINKGSREEAQVISNYQNFHYQVNKVPQRIVTFETTAGKTYEFKFFNESLSQFFQVGMTLIIRCDLKGNAIPDPSFFD